MRLFLAISMALLMALTFAAGPAKADTAPVKIYPKQLLVQPKTGKAAPVFWSDPRGWIIAKQRVFYDRMSRTLQNVKKGSGSAAWLLLALSFIYGVLHAAGPGHGKAVVSAWMLANEMQLRRGIVVASMAAFVQALTAVVLVSVILWLFTGAGSLAREMTGWLEALSFGLIALVGLYLIWQAVRPKLAARNGAAAQDHHHHHHHHAPHRHDHDHQHHEHGPDCGCGHAHMPGAKEVSSPDWSWWKAFSLAVAVGIRPCSGAILVLLLSSTIGLYAVGIASTFAMAVGTAITVSTIAALAVGSKNTLLRFVKSDGPVLANVMFGTRLVAGLFIFVTGGFLFWALLPRLAG